MTVMIENERGDMEKFLRDLPIMLRAGAIVKGVRAAGNVAKKHVKKATPVGDPSHRPEARALKDTLATKVKEYRNGQLFIAIVGHRYPDGAHAHLVEDGHRIRARGKKGQGPGEFTGAKVPGKNYFAPAVDNSKEEQQAALVKKLQDEVEKHAKS